MSGLLKAISNRHETINHNIRHFGIMSQRFRHDTTLHAKCFYAVVNLTQLMIQNGEPLYQVTIFN